MAKSNKKSILDDVAERANIRKDVVKIILESFYDVLAQRLLNGEKVIIKGILSIAPQKTSNGIRPEPHLQLRAKVSRGFRYIFRKKQNDPSYDVSIDNWREKMKESVNIKPSIADFLRDDDEDF